MFHPREDQQQQQPRQISQTIKDLSFAMFMGAKLEAQYKNIIIADRNRKIIEFFSRPVAQVNKQFFKRMIADKLNDHDNALIKEISEPNDPLTDHYGRVTFFNVVLGGELIPVYQPGTIMFESAVREDSEIVIKYDNV